MKKPEYQSLMVVNDTWEVNPNHITAIEYEPAWRPGGTKHLLILRFAKKQPWYKRGWVNFQTGRLREARVVVRLHNDFTYTVTCKSNSQAQKYRNSLVKEWDEMISYK